MVVPAEMVATNNERTGPGSTAEAESSSVRVNGQDVAIRSPMTIEQLIVSLGRDPRVVAVERNGEIVRRAKFNEVRVEAGDVIEVVQFVQGG